MSKDRVSAPDHAPVPLTADGPGKVKEVWFEYEWSTWPSTRRPIRRLLRLLRLAVAPFRFLVRRLPYVRDLENMLWDERQAVIEAITVSDELHTRIEELEKERDEAMASLQVVQNECNAINMQCLGLEKERDEAKKELVHVTYQLDNYTNAYTRTETDFRRTTDRLTETKNDLSSCEKVNRKLIEKSQSLQRDLNPCEESRRKATIELADANKRIDELYNELVVARMDRDCATGRHVEQLAKKLTTTRGELENCRSECRDLERRLTEESQSLQEEIKQRVKLADELRDMTREVEACTRVRVAQADRLSESRELRDKEQEELQAVKDELQVERNELAKMTGCRDHWKYCRNYWKDQCEKLKRQVAGPSRPTTEEHEALTKRCDALEAYNREANTRNDRHLAIIAQLEEEADVVTGECDRLAGESGRMIVQHNLLVGEYEKLEKKFAEKDKLHSKEVEIAIQQRDDALKYVCKIEDEIKPLEDLLGIKRPCKQIGPYIRPVCRLKKVATLLKIMNSFGTIKTRESASGLYWQQRETYGGTPYWIAVNKDGKVLESKRMLIALDNCRHYATLAQLVSNTPCSVTMQLANIIREVDDVIPRED